LSKSRKDRIHLATTICGVFSRNHVRLGITFHVKSPYKTVPISEPMLRAINNDPQLTQRDRDLLNLFAYGGTTQALGNLTETAYD